MDIASKPEVHFEEYAVTIGYLHLPPLQACVFVHPELKLGFLPGAGCNEGDFTEINGHYLNSTELILTNVQCWSAPTFRSVSQVFCLPKLMPILSRFRRNRSEEAMHAFWNAIVAE